MLRGPDSYDKLGILNPTQRRQLVQLARIAPDREKTFIDEVTCSINGYRLRKRCHTQESPAAVAESMRRLIDVITAYARDVASFSDYVIFELKRPPGKNFRTAYLEGLMLPRAADGSIDLTGRPPALIALAGKGYEILYPYRGNYLLIQ